MRLQTGGKSNLHMCAVSLARVCVRLCVCGSEHFCSAYEYLGCWIKYLYLFTFFVSVSIAPSPSLFLLLCQERDCFSCFPSINLLLLTSLFLSTSFAHESRHLGYLANTKNIFLIICNNAKYCNKFNQKDSFKLSMVCLFWQQDGDTCAKSVIYSIFEWMRGNEKKIVWWELCMDDAYDAMQMLYDSFLALCTYWAYAIIACAFDPNKMHACEYVWVCVLAAIICMLEMHPWIKCIQNWKKCAAKNIHPQPHFLCIDAIVVCLPFSPCHRYRASYALPHSLPPSRS